MFNQMRASPKSVHQFQGGELLDFNCQNIVSIHMSSFVANLIRPIDLLDLQFEFVNLTLDVTSIGRPRLRRTNVAPALIVVRLPPQHVAEEVGSDHSSRRFPYKAFLSCPSRIAFEVPENVAEIPFTVDDILSRIAEWKLRTSNPVADGGPATAIEFPDRLLLIPEPEARFFHPAAPATSNATKRTAIWHSRISVGRQNQVSRFRAVHNPADDEDRPMQTTLKKRHRDDIVARSANDPANPHVIASSRFTLSALGASTTLKSVWPDSAFEGLQTWGHDSESGRDFYVHTAEDGFLFPFGHRASLVTVMRRTFSSHPPLVIAELSQKLILHPQEGERNFDNENLKRAYPSNGREMPFKSVRIAPSSLDIANERDPIWLTGTASDASNNLIACGLTMLFVPASKATNLEELRRLRDIYRNHQNVSLENQLVDLAYDEFGREDGRLNVETVRFGVLMSDELLVPVHPPFLPFMENAEVKIPGLEHLLAATPGGVSLPTTKIVFHDKYLRFGFLDGNKKKVFAKFNPVPGITIPPERAGGLAAPRFPNIDGLSKTMGPVSAVDAFAGGGSLAPDQLIGETKLLGVIKLKDIISPADDTADVFPADQLESLYEKLDSPQGTAILLTRPMMTAVKRGSGVETRFLWKPRLNQQESATPLRKRLGVDIELILRGRISKNLSTPSAPPAFEVEGKLKNFILQFADLITLEFNKLEFKSGGARKLDVKVDLIDFQFGPALAFVAKIQKLIPIKSLAGAPVIQPQADGVVVRYGIPIPSLPLGIFSAQNIAFSTSVSLSFVEGKPVAVRFALSERNNPFIVSMSIFGGTGFFALEARTDGSVQVDAAIEFGGIISLNLFVIKGGVYVFAGIFVSVRPDKDIQIEGHLRFGGYVDVLGLITISIEFYIALTYESARNVLYGEGRVIVSVKLIFFSKSFSFTVRKEIPGFGEAPTRSLGSGTTISERASLIANAARIRSVMNLPQWQKYCAAFA
jgi:hypothetical protein